MKTYYYTSDNGRQLSYSDPKRYFWWCGVLVPLVPMFGVIAFLITTSPWSLLVPIIVSMVGIPLGDLLFGADRRNPPEQVVQQLSNDPYYRFILMMAIPMHFAAVLIPVWLVATHHLPIAFFIAFSLMIGVYSGFSINTAHELGHKQTRFERFLARLTCSITGYGHFTIEHNVGHHKHVSTPEDPASARMGESIYRFALREIPGTAKRGWHAERQRLTRQGRSVWSWHNHILQSYLMTVLWQGACVVYFGWIVLPFFLLHNVSAWFQLTSANYIEHYGLLRSKKANGRYERCQPHHSWNANHIFSNLLLFQLERHSDHHANAARPFQSLHTFENLPELPSGYSGMYCIAYIPWLWFWVMDDRLLAIPHINGDLDKVNLDPKNASKIRQRYARRAEQEGQLWLAQQWLNRLMGGIGTLRF